MEVDTAHRPNECTEDEEDVDAREDVAPESKLEWREREIEEEIQCKRQCDNPCNLLLTCHEEDGSE